MGRDKYLCELLLIAIFILGIAACGGGGDSGGGENDSGGDVNPKCSTETVLPDPLIEVRVGSSSTNCYLYSVSPGDTLTISMVGLTGDADLVVLPPETCFIDNTKKIGNLPEDCTLTSTGNQINLAVTGIESAEYTLSIAASPSIAQPLNETATIARDHPTIGQVGSRGTSYYLTPNLTPGIHNVSITGLTGTADLHVYPGAAYVLELDCTLSANYHGSSPQDCRETFTDSIYFSVTSGPLNRDGAAYIILVH